MTNLVPSFPNPFPPPFASAWGDDVFGLWAEFALPLTTENELVIQRLRWIEPGTFWMGSPDDEPERENREGPRHPVTLTKGFWLADTTCTQALWHSVMGLNPSKFDADNQCPVENVSWYEVQTFLEKLEEFLSGCQVNLPSEAEWEYACRAGTDTPFSFGEQITPKLVNYDGNYPYTGGEKGVFREQTVPVKSFPPNAWGLYEMHGNVWEWCADTERTYSNLPQQDPLGPKAQNEKFLYIARGGSWINHAGRARSACRGVNHPMNEGRRLGFRLCLRVIEQVVRTNFRLPQNINPPEEQENDSSESRERVQKLLADRGLASRREIDDWIRKGRVTINGQRAQLGNRVLPIDRVEVDGKLIDLSKPSSESCQVLMFYKPAGVVVSRRDPKGREVVFDDLPKLLQARWIAIGRMEINIEGLLLVTTNGGLADRLIKTSRLSEQKYKVLVKEPVDEAMIARLKSGIMLEDGLAQFDTIQRITDKVGARANHWFYITLKDWRNNVVQRLFESQRVTVIRLIRIRFADLELPKGMKPRSHIKLSPEQVAALMESVGLQGPESDNFR